MAAKQAYLHAVAQHRLGLVAKANKNFGEAVARLMVSDYSHLSADIITILDIESTFFDGRGREEGGREFQALCKLEGRGTLE